MDFCYQLDEIILMWIDTPGAFYDSDRGLMQHFLCNSAHKRKVYMHIVFSFIFYFNLKDCLRNTALEDNGSKVFESSLNIPNGVRLLKYLVSLPFC